MEVGQHKENLTKLSLEELEELYIRQTNILKNKGLVKQLPDQGKQLQDKLNKVEKELKLRRDLKDLEGNLKTLSISSEKSEVLKEKHIQYVCNIEKSPEKERYKPFSTLVHKDEKKGDKPTQLIPLVESITLLAEQATKLPIGLSKKVIEGTPLKEEPEACSDSEENQELSESECEELEKT